MSLAAEEPAGIVRIGEIPGVVEGALFVNREALALAGVHRQRQAGITGTAERGAESIVVSGGYDDIDRGDLILYTGHGGQDAAKKQVADQTFSDSGNAGLKSSMINKAPVRVVRGRGSNKRRRRHISNPPARGYRYDGLYFVVDCWYEVINDFRMCRFSMIKSSASERAAPPIEYELSSERWHGDSPLGNLNPGRKDVVGSRVVRSVEVANSVKRLYDHSCQICGNRLDVSGRGYSEGAHIQALSGGHGGPDVVENVLCLCPNCHVQFDYGSIVIQDDYSLIRNGKPAGKLHKKASHDIDKKYLTYHRERYGE